MLEYLKLKTIAVLTWSACGPDLNIIDNVRALLEEIV